MRGGGGVYTWACAHMDKRFHGALDSRRPVKAPRYCRADAHGRAVGRNDCDLCVCPPRRIAVSLWRDASELGRQMAPATSDEEGGSRILGRSESIFTRPTSLRSPVAKVAKALSQRLGHRGGDVAAGEGQATDDEAGPQSREHRTLHGRSSHACIRS
jgi:hypothetical protein